MLYDVCPQAEVRGTESCVMELLSVAHGGHHLRVYSMKAQIKTLRASSAGV